MSNIIFVKIFFYILLFFHDFESEYDDVVGNNFLVSATAPFATSNSKQSGRNKESSRNSKSKAQIGEGQSDVAGDDDQEPAEENTLSGLLMTIFGEYHKELVPKRPTTVKLDLLMIKVKSTNEREGIFESVVGLFMEWQDNRLQWDSTKYENVTVLAFDSDKVWLPDIAMTNSADHLYSISKDTRFVVRVNNDGTMKFVPTGTTRTWCDLKLITFPFDIQTCSYEFESWSLDSSTMTINETSSALVDEAFSSPQWALCDHSSVVYDHFYEFTGENFTRVRFDFVVQRKSTFYIINLIFPCATLSMIQLMVFLIPSTDATSDRVAFGTTNLLTLVVFQTIVTEQMPKSSDSVTALSKYIIALIVISAVGILESVTAERLLRPTLTPPPNWMLRLKLPILWGSQLPGGISGMMLQMWNTDGQLERSERELKRNCFKKGARRQSLLQPYSRTSFLQPSPSSIVIEEFDPQVDCLGERKRYKVRAKKKKPKERQLQVTAIDRSRSLFGQSSSDPIGYETKIRDSPSPVFESKSTLYRLNDCSIGNQSVGYWSMIGTGHQQSSSPARGLEAASPPHDVESVESYASAAEGVLETTDLVVIGKMWGTIVTGLDGLTFLMCASSAIFLPLLLFLPVALMEDKCLK